MITLSAAQKQYLLDDDYRVEMEVNTVNEDDITITEADLVQGSFSGNRFSCVGNTIEVGSANAAEISFTLRNDDGALDDVVFEGAQVIVWLRRGNAGSYTLNLRLFTARVDEVRHAIDSIQLVLLDSMVKLDRVAANLTYNTPQGVVQQICSACGITYNSAKSSLVNGTVALATPTTENLSYRQVLMWIAQITGTCAFIDPEDKLVLNWYTNYTSDEVDYIQKSNRFSSDLDENEIIVTGVSATVGEATYYNKDDSVDVDYLIAIEGNELISADNVNTILSGLANRLIGFAYTPFSATTMNMCWLQPLDMTEFWDKDDNPHEVIITDWTFTPHASLQLAGKGESATRKGYASNPPFTAQQSRIIEKLKRDVENVDVDDRITAVLGLNDAINHGMMLHSTTIDGKEYRHNAALISDSTYICTANSGGFAWTNSGWNDGDPVWEYGISSDGSAVLEQLSAYAISADVVSTGILQSTDGSTTLDMTNGTASFFNGALLYDSVHGFRFGTNVTFGVGNLGQDVLDLIEQGSDGIDVHATAGTLATNNYPLTTTEQVTELAEGQTVEITFPNGIDFTLNTSGSTYLYKPRTVSIGNNTYTLLNANGTTDWCNVKNSTDYASNVSVKYIVRTINNTLVLCELIEAENVLGKVLEQGSYPSLIELTEKLTNPTTGTVLKCNTTGLTYGLGITQDTNDPSFYISPYFGFTGNTSQWLLSKAHYDIYKGIADAYSASDLYMTGMDAAADYSGTCSSAANDNLKWLSSVSPSGFSLRNGVTVAVTFTYANTVLGTGGTRVYLQIGSTDAKLVMVTNDGGQSASTVLGDNNWDAGETRIFKYDSDWDVWFISKPTYYYTIKTEDEPTGVSSVYVILENLRTSNGTELRAFELRYEPVSLTPGVIAIDEEARAAAAQARADAAAALTAASGASSTASTANSTAVSLRTKLINLCTDNNMTLIDGGNVYADTLNASDALLYNLMAHTATITGLLKLFAGLNFPRWGAGQRYLDCADEAAKACGFSDFYEAQHDEDISSDEFINVLNVANVFSTSFKKLDKAPFWFETYEPYNFSAVCDTSASTQTKSLSIDEFELSNRELVIVRFTNKNTVSYPSLNINNSIEKPIYYESGGNYYALTTSSGENWNTDNSVKLFRYMQNVGSSGAWVIKNPERRIVGALTPYGVTWSDVNSFLLKEENGEMTEQDLRYCSTFGYDTYIGGNLFVHGARVPKIKAGKTTVTVETGYISGYTDLTIRNFNTDSVCVVSTENQDAKAHAGWSTQHKCRIWVTLSQNASSDRAITVHYIISEKTV